MFFAITIALALCVPAFAQEVVGARPYEMDWAGRTEDHHPPLVDFEDLNGWMVETRASEAGFERSREQQLFGDYVGKLTYRGVPSSPEVRILPPAPIAITQPFDAITLWVWGNNWASSPDPTTPQVSIYVLLEDSAGAPLELSLTRVYWKEWFMPHLRLSPEQIERVRDGAKFLGFAVRGGHQPEDRVLFFDSLVFFTEELTPLQFEPRPLRGIDLFPGQSAGLNTGPGRLPFPTRAQTILPPNLTADFTTELAQDGDAWVFTYRGADGVLTYRVAPATGTWSDLSARWEGRGGEFRPCVNGGVYLQTADGPRLPERAELRRAEREGDALVLRWAVAAGDAEAEVAYTLRLWGKSLVIDTVCPGGVVGEVRYGAAEGLENPWLVTNPYYVYRGTRPAVVVAGPPDAPLFVTGNTDWYLSNASEMFGVNEVREGRATYQGGVRYLPKTDGVRTDCFERFFLTASPRYEEVLPVIPNPRSEWYPVTATRVWRAHGAGNRENDAAYWRNVHRWGMTEMVVTDHETMWRDGGESFTFRVKAAPGKGGDQGAYDYARIMQDELGFVYGPYNNFTDLAAVNGYFSIDMVCRDPDGQLRRAWQRCYAPKPGRAVEYCALLSPQIEEKFHFSTAYCDVHTAVAPWDREDYDARVPGAATFGQTFYNYGEIMLLQKAAWDGPVYSEGGMHWMYVGLTDGNYAQDQRYDPNNNPWLVDFDLRRMHDLCTGFGMGNLGMFYGRNTSLGSTRAEVDASIDRFLAATVAFGHTGFLVMDGGFHNGLRSYYMLQQLHSHYAQAGPLDIRYVDADGRALATTEAIATGAYRRSQVVTRYDDGTVTAANGSRTERMRCEVFGRRIDLPPNGYAGWADGGRVEVLSSDASGHRTDYAVTPAYTYLDGRGEWCAHPQATGNGIGICRHLPDGTHEVLLYQGAECGFRVDAGRAVALDAQRNEIGPAELRRARGYTYVAPVEGAVSYLLSGPAPQVTDLQCARALVIPGETVTVRGEAEHELTIPADAEPGERLWRQLEDRWIDFTVVPLTAAKLSLDGDTLVVALTSNRDREADFTITLGAETRKVTLRPEETQSVRFDLGPPIEEASELLNIEVRSDELVQRIEAGMQVILDLAELAPMPTGFETGMCLRGGEETADFGETRGNVGEGARTCDTITKRGLTAHPPWIGGTGYVFATFDPVTLPAQPPAAWRMVVGKGDGSDRGDGILYKLAVIDATGAETIIAERVVAEHAWLPIEGDLTPWAGQTVRLKLIIDAGADDNTSGDWACAAEMRIETLQPQLLRMLEGGTEAMRREPGPFPVTGLTIEDLRGARSGRVHYDGIGLSGTGEAYGSFAVLNGVELGNMAPAGGSEAQGIWAEDVTVELTPEAIATLGFRNLFEVHNPKRDWFKVRRFWIELELADGRAVSSQISVAAYTQPPEWPYAEGIGVPFGENIAVEIWFAR